jgi:hypothetical protein
MKKLNIRRCIRLILCFCLFAILIGSLTACRGSMRSTPGETVREVHTRHVGVVKTNWLEMQDDIDAVLMLDKPSRLSDKLIR